MQLGHICDKLGALNCQNALSLRAQHRPSLEHGLVRHQPFVYNSFKPSEAKAFFLLDFRSDFGFADPVCRASCKESQGTLGVPQDLIVASKLRFESEEGSMARATAELQGLCEG